MAIFKLPRDESQTLHSGPNTFHPAARFVCAFAATRVCPFKYWCMNRYCIPVREGCLSAGLSGCYTTWLTDGIYEIEVVPLSCVWVSTRIWMMLDDPKHKDIFKSALAYDINLGPRATAVTCRTVDQYVPNNKTRGKEYDVWLNYPL